MSTLQARTFIQERYFKRMPKSSVRNVFNHSFRRYQRDKEVNASRYYRLTANRGKISVASSDLKVGDVIYVEKGHRVPADMIFLRTTEASGSCFIRTDQLDGETDWKLRYVLLKFITD